MRCLTVFALFMWLLVVSRSSDYWLGISPRVTLIALVDVEVCLGIPLCVTRWVPRGSRGLILGSTGRGRPIIGIDQKVDIWDTVIQKVLSTSVPPPLPMIEDDVSGAILKADGQK